MSGSYSNKEKARDRCLALNTNIFGLPSREGHLSLVKIDVIVLDVNGLVISSTYSMFCSSAPDDAAKTVVIGKISLCRVC